MSLPLHAARLSLSLSRTHLHNIPLYYSHTLLPFYRYCFTDSMRPLVTGPFSDEISYFFDQQGIDTLAHTARWSGAVQFVHAVARRKEGAQPR